MKEKKIDIIVFIYSFLIAGICSINLGMDRSFDVRNYHIYNAWAFLTKRVGFDVMPGDIQSYFNPYIDVPYFEAIKHLNSFPYIVVFLQGITYALFVFIIYKLAYKVFKKNYFYTAITTLIGATSAIALFNIGTLMHDLFIGDVILASFYCVLKYTENQKNSFILFSGFLLGLASALKLTAGLFFVPVLLSLCVCYKPLKLSIKSIIYFILGFVCMFLIVDGYWLYKIYSTLGNPVFPYLNSLFKSTYVGSNQILGEDFKFLRPQSVMQYIFFPFYFYQHVPTRGFELNYQDYRLAGVYTVTILNVIYCVYAKIKNISSDIKEIVNFDFIKFLIVLNIVTYIIWINVFANIRYIVALFAISGIIIIGVCLKIFNSKYNKIAMPIILILVTYFLVLKTIPPKMNMRIPIKKNLLEVEDMNIPDNSIVIVESGSAILLPYQNEKAKYVYLNAPRFTKANVNILSDEVINSVKSDIKNDNLYVIISLTNTKYNLMLLEKSIARFINFKGKKLECKVIQHNISNVRVDMNYNLCKFKNK